MKRWVNQATIWVASGMLALGTIFVTNWACFGFFGEPEIPESLRQANN